MPSDSAGLGTLNDTDMIKVSPKHRSVYFPSVLFPFLGRAMCASYSAQSLRTWQCSSTAPFSSRVGDPRRIARSLFTALPCKNEGFSSACYQQLSVTSRIGWWESPKKPALRATSWRAAHLLLARLASSWMVAMAVLADRYGFVLAGLSAEETRTRGVRSSSRCVPGSQVTPRCSMVPSSGPAVQARLCSVGRLFPQ